MTATIENIGKLRYFTGVDASQMGGIPHMFSEKSFIKGQTIVAEGERDESLHFVSSGVVKIFKTSTEGKEQIIKLARPGESFIDIAVFSDGPSPYSAQALGTITMVYKINKNDLMPVMKTNWKVAMNAIETLAEQSRLLLTLIEDLSFKNVTNRVAKNLLQHAAQGPEGMPRLTQYEMAAMAGTAREVVGRSLKTLEDTGAIKLERHRIVISNKKYLEQLAGLN